MLEQIADNLYVDPAAVVAVEVQYPLGGFPRFEVVARHSGGAISVIETFTTTYGGCMIGESVADATARTSAVYEQQKQAAHEAADRYTKWVNDRK